MRVGLRIGEETWQWDIQAPAPARDYIRLTLTILRHLRRHLRKEDV